VTISPVLLALCGRRERRVERQRVRQTLQFDGPFYAIGGSNLLAANTAAPPTIASLKFYLSQVTATATAESIIVVDNISIRPI